MTRDKALLSAVAVALFIAAWSCGVQRAAPPRDAGVDATADAAADAATGCIDDAGRAMDACTTALASADAGIDAEADDAGSEATVPAPVGTSEGCPDDMVLVDGHYCPIVDQVCLEHASDYEKDRARKLAMAESSEADEPSTVSERCLRYKEPSECLSERRAHLRFCIDRYEWPNVRGELPSVLLSWRDAKKKCEQAGKRLCTENEFNFACEGEQMLPYTYGYARDPAACNIDRRYRKRERTLKKWERCVKDPKCKAELEKLDQRVPAGSMPRCVSPFGVYDLNGNVNEWVFRRDGKFPERSALKGGWWGPVRSRCRPTVAFHKEEDYGYEEGFRCCKEASKKSAAP